MALLLELLHKLLFNQSWWGLIPKIYLFEILGHIRECCVLNKWNFTAKKKKTLACKISPRNQGSSGTELNEGNHWVTLVNLKVLISKLTNLHVLPV